MLPAAAFWVAGWAAGAHPRAAAICKNLRLVFIGIVLRGLLPVVFRERVHRSYRKDQGVRIGTLFSCKMNLKGRNGILWVDPNQEVLALRQQVAVLKRKRPKPRLNRLDRLFWTLLRSTWSRWRDAVRRREIQRVRTR